MTTIKKRKSDASVHGIVTRPILFSGPMVRAILEGTKTQTGRVVKAINHELFDAFTEADPSGFWGFDSKNDPVLCVHSPYGEVGDRLWVRETWRTGICFDSMSPDLIGRKCVDAGYKSPWGPVRYEADGDDKWLELLKDFGGEWGKTRVSIHMPRWASRITLQITGLRIERLTDISAEDAIAEGAVADDYQWSHVNSMCRDKFRDLWESINGKGSWADDPWVWVVQFKRVSVRVTL
jgi:hypothetical protein